MSALALGLQPCAFETGTCTFPLKGGRPKYWGVVGWYVGGWWFAKEHLWSSHNKPASLWLSTNFISKPVLAVCCLPALLLPCALFGHSQRCQFGSRVFEEIACWGSLHLLRIFSRPPTPLFSGFEELGLKPNSTSNFQGIFELRSQLKQPFPIRARFELNLNWIELELNWIELNSARPRGGGLYKE